MFKTTTKSGTVVLASTPETAEKVAAKSARLTARGILNIVFPCPEMAAKWLRRIAALHAADAEKNLALERQTDRNARRRAKRREQASAA